MDNHIRELERRVTGGDLVAKDLLAVEHLRLGLCPHCLHALGGESFHQHRTCEYCKLVWTFPSLLGGLFSYGAL